MTPLEDVLQQQGAVRFSRTLRDRATALVRTGVAVRILPGVLALTSRAQAWDTRALAVCLYDPHAVLTGAAAARLSFWPTCPLDHVSWASPRQYRLDRPGLCPSRRIIPPDLCVRRGSMTLTHPALTALDLTTEADASPIDQVLRTRAATLDQIQSCLDRTGGRVGNTERRWIVIDSAMKPWSEAERLLHRIMRRLGLASRWHTNWPVFIEGERFHIDVAIPGLRIAIEADGFEFHSDRDAFEHDRHRQNLLVLDGWLILRFTWRQLLEDPVECGRQILLAVRRARRQMSRQIS